MSRLAILGSCLSFVFLFFSTAFAADRTNAEEFQYQQLKRDWWQLFPDGNRNAGGPKFFNYALNISKNFTEFQKFNKLFCPVSGSLINPHSIPEIVYINEEGSSRKICGQLYRCCWPCSCDVMKHVTAEKFQVKFDDKNNEIFLLKIKNPCLKENFPEEVNRSYFCKGDTVNLDNVHFSSEKITVGMLHNAHVCSNDEITRIDNHKITGGFCPIRNNTPISEIKGGMGDIFIKIAQ